MANSHSPIYLKDVAAGELREALLADGIRERHLSDVDAIWQPALSVLQRWAGESHREESAHWDWRTKMRPVRRSRKQRSFAIEFDGLTQGLMIVDTSRKARLDPDCGAGLVYVDYVEVAPWNRHGWRPHRVFGSIGSHFLSVAIDLSFQLGFAGRIGLHSLPQADSFYRHHRMTDLGVDSDYGQLHYFEIDTVTARMSRMKEQP